jgi:hypothetical protein
VRVPVGLDSDPRTALRYRYQVARGELFDTPKNALIVRCREITHEMTDRIPIEIAGDILEFKNRLHFRSEVEPVVHHAVVQWLYTKPVAGYE